jgi:endoglucanase
MAAGGTAMGGTAMGTDAAAGSESGADASVNGEPASNPTDLGEAGNNETGSASSPEAAPVADTVDSPEGGDASANGDGAASPDAPEPFTFGEPPVAARYFKRGINLGNRLEAPNEGDWGGSVLEGDFPFIAQRGFDHVRIPMRFSGHAQSSAPFTIDPVFFERIDAVLEQAASAGLAAIIDMHAYDEMASDPSGERERFLALWRQIAERYRDQPESVAFELLNEPNTELDTLWNDILAAAIAAVRTTNPRRLLVVDTVFWADPSKLSVLTLPDDANLLVSIHLYEPKLFSFQGKSWMGDPYMTTGVIFPGPPASPVTPVQAALDQSWAASWFEDYNTLPADENPSGSATIDAQLAYVTAYTNASGRTVYNGEWGPQDVGDMTSRVNLVQMVREKCEAADIGWAIWEDPNNMKLFDSSAGTWVTPIIDALLP